MGAPIKHMENILNAETCNKLVKATCESLKLLVTVQ